MTAQELRIGNYVGHGVLHTGIGRDNRDYYTVKILKETVMFFNESNTGEYYKDVQPIPLTDEWLLKFGFENIGGYLWNCRELGENRFINNPYGITHFEIKGHYEKKHIQYVHQLQNLYWCLCGKELEINL